MALSDKVKTSLDETRTLMLGAQILLGFQFNGAFRPRFDALPPSAKLADIVALVLMLVAVSLLIAHSAFHRIVDRGESTGRTQTITSVCAALALVPFATALGLDLSIALSRALQSSVVGILAGAGFALVSASAWFGTGWIMKTDYGRKERQKAGAEREARETAPLHSRIEQMLTEARVILPGAQALFGFQLAIVLTEAFEKLSPVPRLLHGLALLCVAVSVVLLIAPAAIHRIVWAGEDSESFLRIGGRITIAALVPLAIGMAADCYVVLSHMLGASVPAAVAAALVLLSVLSLWFAWPFIERSRQSGRTRRIEPAQPYQTGGR